ncbi:MAG: hypothetical protein KU37_06370 [Sulfuricurvum sp. PC08-66]|nr:MAG: hypothetical protein KU37_06370 [Sulfuricurvum sp. PC08-66]
MNGIKLMLFALLASVFVGCGTVPDNGGGIDVDAVDDTNYSSTDDNTSTYEVTTIEYRAIVWADAMVQDGNWTMEYKKNTGDGDDIITFYGVQSYLEDNETYDYSESYLSVGINSSLGTDFFNVSEIYRPTIVFRLKKDGRLLRDGKVIYDFGEFGSVSVQVGIHSKANFVKTSGVSTWDTFAESIRLYYKTGSMERVFRISYGYN